ncbi:MAG: histidine phosphatase family protein [Planctomycetes bacterium]|nr:histidine phosphatase family protein [Planctomycetota bacterium]
MSTLVCLRHGETDFNRRSVVQGQLDVPLNENGRRQVQRAAARFTGQRFEAVYASDLLRARESAAIIAGALGLEPRAWAELREQHLGEWQGRPWPEVRELWREGVSASGDLANDQFRPPGGETYAEMFARVFAAFTRIADAHPKGAALVVTHGGVKKVMVYHTLGLAFSQPRRFDATNGGVSIFHREGGQWLLGCLNDTSHLAGLDNMRIV